MDDEQYRQTHDAIDLPPCVYEKALQHGYFVCQYAQNIALGEREALRCQTNQDLPTAASILICLWKNPVSPSAHSNFLHT